MGSRRKADPPSSSPKGLGKGHSVLQVSSALVGAGSNGEQDTELEHALCSCSQ